MEIVYTIAFVYNMYEEEKKKKERVAILSVVSNTTLVAMKLTVGLTIGSVAIISEAIHSAVDLLAACIAWFAISQSSKPPDVEHPFGHGKIENISATIEALLIFVAAGWIIYESVHKLGNPRPMKTVTWGVLIMFISVILNVFVSRLLFKVGEETGSVALKADAWHLRTDVYTSAGVMLSLGIIWAGGMWYPSADLNWIDPVCAIVVALVITKAAYDLVRESSRDLLDVKLPENEEQIIHDRTLSFPSQVRSFSSLKTRKSGPYRFANITLIVDSSMSVDLSHRIADAITREIEKELPNITVNIHIEPCKFECEPDCVINCQLSENERMELYKKNDPDADKKES